MWSSAPLGSDGNRTLDSEEHNGFYPKDSEDNRPLNDCGSRSLNLWSIVKNVTFRFSAQIVFHQPLGVFNATNVEETFKMHMKMKTMKNVISTDTGQTTENVVTSKANQSLNKYVIQIEC